MRLSVSTVFFALVSLLCATTTVFAASKKKDNYDLVEINNDKSLKFVYDFPKTKNAKFDIDQVGVVRINITNTGSTTKSIYGFTAAITDLNDEKKVLQKFPMLRVTFTVRPNKTISYRHLFKPEMEAQDAQLLILVDYYDKEDEARVFAVRTPIKLVYSDTLFDLQSIVMYIFSIALMVFAGFFFYNVAFVSVDQKPTKPKKQRSSRTDSVASSGTSAAVAAPENQSEPDMEWIPDHVKEQQRRSSTSSKASTGASGSRKRK